MDCIRVCQSRITTQNKYLWVIEGDIQGCFDHVQHAILLKLVKRRIRDKRVVGLIAAMLKAGLMEERAWRSVLNQRGAWWNSGASHMNQAFPELYFDRLGLVSLLDTTRRLQCVQ